jgi:hypothetical protein
MPDLNLDLDYFAHPKTTRLIGLLGKGAEVLPIKLWAYCGKYHKEHGKLTGYSTQEIESIVGWWGDSGVFIQAMLKVRFLDDIGGDYACHNWAARNGHLEALSEKNRAAANARWDKIRKQRLDSMRDDASGMPQALPTHGSGMPQPTNLPTNQPTDQKQQQGEQARTSPPSGKDLRDGKVDLENFIRIWWGSKEGNLAYAILVQFVQLSKQYGEAAVGEAIIQAAKQNVRKLAYVQGILNPRAKEQPRQTSSPRTGEAKAVGELIAKVLKFPCEDHPEILVTAGEQCPLCFPKCKKCGEEHWIGETCEEWKARIPEIKKMLQS